MRALFVLVLAAIVGVFIYLVVTFIASSTTGRGELACGYARSQIGDNVGPMGLYRGSHPCSATAVDQNETLWALDGVYRSGLASDVQPSIPYAGMVIWDDDNQIFRTCIIEFRRAGENSAEIETLQPASLPALCPE
jgi:hypothetical protein